MPKGGERTVSLDNPRPKAKFGFISPSQPVLPRSRGPKEKFPPRREFSEARVSEIGPIH